MEVSVMGFLDDFVLGPWKRKVLDAIAKDLETDHFSDEWCRATAQQRCKELLTNARCIEQDEAQRRLEAKRLDKEYKEIAKCAFDLYGYDKDTLIEALRKSDELPIR